MNSSFLRSHQSSLLVKTDIPCSKNRKTHMGISNLKGYNGIRNAPAAFSPTISEFQPIQDPCQTNTPIKEIKLARVIILAISLIFGGKWS